MLAGALIRHSFVARHRAHVEGRRTPWEQAVVGVLVLVGLALWLAPPPPSAESRAAAAAAAARPAGYAELRVILDQRCVLCHNAQVQQKNVALHTAEEVRRHAQQIYQQVSVLKLMPMNNATQITDAERDLVARWFKAGAPVE